MKALPKRILKINSYGELVEYNSDLMRWELTNGVSWSWSDITPGYRRESKRNYKHFNKF